MAFVWAVLPVLDGKMLTRRLSLLLSAHIECVNGIEAVDRLYPNASTFKSQLFGISVSR